MNLKTKNLLLTAVALPMSLVANATADWQSKWCVESESPDYKVTQLGGDTLEILSPKGLTLWHRQKLKGDMTVEYDACVVDEGKPGDRLSDMNLFWMASDPKAKDIFQRMAQRNGVFANCSQLQLYYLGYGGNYNSTTRFRRYHGEPKPAIVKEYTDADHLLKPNHWYHLRVQSLKGLVNIYVDGKLIVSYRDANPLTSGWFGFRTTLSRTRIANFTSRKSSSTDVPLHWVGSVPEGMQMPVSFGIPFAKGELRKPSDYKPRGMAADTWTTAMWPDGSVKWLGVAGVTGSMATMQRPVVDANTITIDNGKLKLYVARHGRNLIDSLIMDGKKICDGAHLVATTTNATYASVVDSAVVERAGSSRALIKICGTMSDGSRRWLPFTLRLYAYAANEQLRMVHSFIYDGDQDKDFISSLGLTFDVPLRKETYNRHVMFAMDGGKMWHEPVQPLDGRSPLDRNYNWQERQQAGFEIPAANTFDERQQTFLSEWASWDGFRLSQLNDGSFTIRKKAQADRPWIGTFTGHRSNGLAFVGDTEGGLALSLKDFWQQYPSTLQISDARADKAQLTVYLWSPEAEPMDLRHYDTVAHGLISSYEDVQQGMSTPYGIARTSEVTFVPFASLPSEQSLSSLAGVLAQSPRLLPTPDYLHSKQAFGRWSLTADWKSVSDNTSAANDTITSRVEQKLQNWINIYRNAIDDNHWYGFWNYGDVMHAYDAERKEWRYDVGGFAWDNTELATPDWLWYSFLRTGDSNIWRMAEAMTRHNSEVDTYHIGPMAGLGSRHNVSHWGCGAKEARISQAAFNRFFYYLTTDERIGDLMTAVKDADQMLYTIDPMRLAEPKSQYPCNAPARLRIGPDWLSYVGNWMTEWERTGNTKYRNKIMAGMKSIGSLPDGLFTGNKALGFDPKTGVLSYDGTPGRRNTNHLMTIMGGFETMIELEPMLWDASFDKAWLAHARDYKRNAMEISKNHFPVRRLEAYAASRLHDASLTHTAWHDLLYGRDDFSTNSAALWSLDAIYMLEVLDK